MAHGEDYETFVKKFEQKLTTDDCYMQPVIYDAVADWVENEFYNPIGDGMYLELIFNEDRHEWYLNE